MDQLRFQILALDGGGYKGIFAAAVLACLESDLGISVGDHFDLVAGTSTGGIIALALGAGKRPSEIVDFYLRHGRAIFKAPRTGPARRLWRSKYSAAPLRSALEEVLADKLLCDSTLRLVVPAYDLRTDDVKVFRTPHHDRLKRDWKELMVDVALSTSAAPTYLPAHSLRGQRLVDGGLWANNPSLCAVVEAIGTLNVPPESIWVFSLGTTCDLQARPKRLDSGGILPWALDAAKVIMQAQSTAANNAAFHLLPRGQLVRVNPPVPSNLLRLDGVSPEELRGRAERESLHISQTFFDAFCKHKPPRFEPIYCLGREPSGDV